MTGRDLTLVVPLYDEAARFAAHAGELAAFVAGQPEASELVFVDDGSSDGTPALVERFISEHPGMRVRLLRRPHRGKGAALRAGLADASTALAAFCDLDCSTPLRDVAELVDAAHAAPVLAIGSRDLATSTVTRHENSLREFLGRTFNRVVQLSLTPGILDTQCGAKAARTDVWRRVLPWCREDGFAWDVEVVAVARRLGIPAQEVAIEWAHDPGSRVRVARDGTAMVAALPRIARSVARAGGPRLRQERGPHGGIPWWPRSTAALVSWAIKRWPPPSGPLVVTGTAAAAVTASLGWRPRQAVVVERDGDRAAAGRARYALQAVRAAPDSTPLADGVAAVVCLVDALDTAGDPEAVLAEAGRVLALGGRLVVTGLDDDAGPRLRADLERLGFVVHLCEPTFPWLRPARRMGWHPAGAADAEAPLLLDRLALLLTRSERVWLTRWSRRSGAALLCVATNGRGVR